MFAIVLSEMGPFFTNIGSFPTVIYTVLLGVCLVFWLIAILGLIDLEIIDLEMDLEMHGLEVDVDVDMDVDAGESNMGFLAGLLFKLKLVGVPLTVTLTILMLTGWLLSYYTVHFLYPFIPNAIPQFLVGIPVFIATLYVAAKITAKLINPLKPLFANEDQQIEKKLLGQTVTVRTSRVDDKFGEAIFEDGGAGLLLKIRSKGGERFTKGDRVIILQRLGDDNVYQVISEDEFMLELPDQPDENYELKTEQTVQTTDAK